MSDPDATTRSIDALFAAPRLRRIGWIWLAVALPLLALRLLGQTRAGLSDGDGHPFGEDFLNFWSAPWLAVHGRAAEIYDIARFHRFEVGVVGHAIDLYHYSYPPVMLLLSAPFALLPYPLAWAAWTGLSWAAFAWALRANGSRSLLLAAALPAVFINAAGGQNGCWTAAIVGGGTALLDRRPLAAGLLLSLLVFKPQLAWLLPVALLAGGHWRALVSLAGGALLWLGLSLLLFGADPWTAYAAQAQLLRVVILENGSGTWHRMISLFVLARHAGLPVGLAYGVQALASAGIAAAVALAWRSNAPAEQKRALLVLGMLLASPYVSDYDLVVAALVPLWLWHDLGTHGRAALALLVLTPLVTAPAALASGIAVGALLGWPAMIAVLRSTFREAKRLGRRAAPTGRSAHAPA